jgi:hypothetical protein
VHPSGDGLDPAAVVGSDEDGHPSLAAVDWKAVKIGVAGVVIEFDERDVVLEGEQPERFGVGTTKAGVVTFLGVGRGVTDSPSESVVQPIERGA